MSSVAVVPTTGTPRARSWRWPAIVRVPARLLWTYVPAVLLCQSLFGAVLVFGWITVSMRATIRHAFAGEPGTPDVVPNWLRYPDAEARMEAVRNAGWFRRLRMRVWVNVGYPWVLFRTGLSAAGCTYAYTLPGGLLFFLAWEYGWDNSFFKIYEQRAALGGMAAASIFLSTAGLVFAPFAHAAYARHGHIGAAINFRKLWRGISIRPWAVARLALAFSLMAFPAYAVVAFTGLLARAVEGYESMSDAEVLDYARGYFASWTLVLFPIYWKLHTWTAQVYAKNAFAYGAAQQAAQSHVPSDGTPQGPRKRNRVAVGLGVFAIFLAWMLSSPVFLVVQQFFANHGPRPWMSQPMVHLPWFQYIPGHLLP